jgi:hypothetical protein
MLHRADHPSPPSLPSPLSRPNSAPKNLYHVFESAQGPTSQSLAGSDTPQPFGFPRGREGCTVLSLWIPMTTLSLARQDELCGEEGLRRRKEKKRKVYVS